MQQRNGNDELCRVTFIVSIIVYVLSVVLNSSLFYLLALCGIIYSLFRMFSKNVPARQKENQQFLQFFSLQKKDSPCEKNTGYSPVKDVESISVFQEKREKWR